MEHLSAGWEDENLGSVITVELRRLKVEIESIVHFGGAARDLRSHVQAEVDSGAIAESLGQAFLDAW